MSTKRLFIPMTKYDAEKGIAYGVAASSSLDRSGEIFDYAGSKPHFEKWSAAAVAATAGKSFGNLRSMHGNVAAGKLEQITFNDDDELIEIAAKVVDVNEQKKCEEGVYTGFSMGGKYIKKWADKENPKATRYIADPYEISLVDLPCIPDATFEYVKSAGASELRKFHVDAPVIGEVKEPTNTDVVGKAEAMAIAAGKPGDWLTFVEDARKALTTTPATTDELAPKHVLELAVTAVEDDAVGKAAGAEEDWSQAWISPRLPGQTFAKKADLRTALTELDATETAVKLAAPATDALKALTDALDERVPVEKNSSDNPDFAKDKDKTDPKDKTAPAKSGAAKPKDEKTKAKEEADKSKPMKSAIDVISRAKLLAAETVPSFTERREIIKAATELNALAVLPDGFIDAPDDRLAKSASPELKKAATLYSVSNLISLICQLESFHTRLSCDPSGSYYSYDGGEITRVEVAPELMTSIGDLCDQLGDKAALLLDQVLSAMKSEDAEKAVGRGTVLADLRKVGARNSVGDKTRLRKAHDLLAEIEPEMCGAEKHEHGGDVNKVLEAQQDAFTKTVSGIVDAIKDVAERVKRIEAQPVGGRPTHVNVVEKFGQVEDGVFTSAGPSAQQANKEAFVAMQAESFRLSASNR